MKKLIALLLSIAMVACLFVGCAGGETETPTTTEAPTQTANPDVTVDMDVTEAPTDAPKEPVTLRFWQAGGDTVGASSVMRLLLDKFELMYPWIRSEEHTSELQSQ